MTDPEYKVEADLTRFTDKQSFEEFMDSLDVDYKRKGKRQRVGTETLIIKLEDGTRIEMLEVPSEENDMYASYIHIEGDSKDKIEQIREKLVETTEYRKSEDYGNNWFDYLSPLVA